jgi:hypothetical protein
VLLLSASSSGLGAFLCIKLGKQDCLPSNQTAASPARIFHAARRPMCLKKRMEYACWRRMFTEFHAAQLMRPIASYDFIENNAMLTPLTPAIKSKSSKPSAHIPCALQAYVLEEAHGICVLAGMLVKFHAAQLMKSIAPYKSLRFTKLIEIQMRCRILGFTFDL